MLSLREIVALLSAPRTGTLDLEKRASGVSFSSQDCAGKIFVAVSGVKLDGHSFLEEALKNGAVALIVQEEKYLKDRPAILVSDSRSALSKLAAIFAGEPSKQLKILGITGTNGKTTTNWMTHNLLLACGVSSMRLGTLGLEAKLASGEIVMEHRETLTTPDAVEIQEKLKSAVAAGIRACVLEVSSHALCQSRADDLHFDTAIFTNLTRDHLDYHPDMEHYYCSKRRLFDLAEHSSKTDPRGIINLDSEYGARLVSELPIGRLKVVTTGMNSAADARIEAVSMDGSGTLIQFRYEGAEYKLKSPYIGAHNAENLLCALLAVHSHGHDMRELVYLCEKLPQVPGRLQSVGTKDIGVYVDYAHTPDALEHVIRTLRSITKGSLWVVFGCGGDRDRGKRPQMAKIASELGDRVVVTSDNPRTEDPISIIEEILTGSQKRDLVEPDRRLAIKAAVKSASKGDVVLIAGKGHEDYQIIGTTKHPFSDVEEVNRVLSS